MHTSRSITSTSEERSSRKEEAKERDEEDILVYVNFNEMTEEYFDEDLQNCKILGLDTNEPILQIGKKVFGGSWEEIIGTAVFFDENEPILRKTYFSVNITKPLKFGAKTQKTLNMRRVFVTATGTADPKSCNLSKSKDEEEQMEID